MIIGIDFDNTIVSYEGVFYRIALEKKLIPADIPENKDSVRNYLRKIGREDDWTELQGYVYGARMKDAKPYEGFTDFLATCRRVNMPLRVVSHKTRYPYLGHKYDLHLSAKNWLVELGFFSGEEQGNIYFELTKEDKIKRIEALGCTHFIDDLPEFLTASAFPDNIEKMLFDPHGQHANLTGMKRYLSWSELNEWIKNRG